MKFIFWILAILYALVESQGFGDFYIYVSAGGKLLQGENIYVIKFQEFYHYYYSVLFALILSPFFSAPFFWLKFIWLIFNLSLVYMLFLKLASSKIFDSFSLKQKQLFLFLVFVISFRFLHENIHYSQITILLLWTCVIGLLLVFENKPVLGGAVLALGINIKLFPVVFLPYLFYRGYFKALTFTICFYLISLFFPSFFLKYFSS